MPQPVHRVLPNPNMEWWDDVLPHRPQLAIHIARIIVAWAEVEIAMAEALSAMLGSQDAAFAMFQALTSAVQKKRALDAAAAETLPPEYKDVFDAIVSEAYRAEGLRDKIAHATWAITDQLPEALLMISPKIRGSYMRRYNAERAATTKGKRPKYPSFQWDQVYVYKQMDFTNMFDRIHRTLHNLLAVTPLLNPECPRRAQRFAALSSEPHIQELLRRKKG